MKIIISKKIYVWTQIIIILIINLFSKKYHTGKINNKSENEKFNINDNLFINENFYPKFINNVNINVNEVDIIDVAEDGNCFMRCITLFVYRDENKHIRTRQEIANYLYANYRNFENISIPTEEGMKTIIEYGQVNQN